MFPPNGIPQAVIPSVGAATSSSSTTVTLTSNSPVYQNIAMTVMGQSVVLPDATTLTTGGPKFIIRNVGGYPFGIRDSSGVLLTGVAAGGITDVDLSDNSTSAGTWGVNGTNLEPGLITIDNTFSSTYASTVLKPFVALDANKSIHFLMNTAGTGIYAVAVDKTTSAVGTPILLLSSSVSSSIRAAFSVSSTSAIVFMTDNNGPSPYAIVVSISGSTTLSAGTLVGTGVIDFWAAEDFSSAPKIVQLSSTLYLASYTSGTNTSVVAVSVSGTTVTIGTAANIITANSVANSTTTYALTATTALVIYSDTTGAANNYAVVVSVSGTTCTVGTPSAAISAGASGGAPFSCLLSPTKAIVSRISTTLQYIYAITISGTTVTVGSACIVESGATGLDQTYTANSATRYNPHLFPLSASTALLWYLDGSGISRAVVLSESGGTVTAGTILYSSISQSSSNTDRGGQPLAMSTTTILAAQNQYATSGLMLKRLRTHKISGTAVTTGSTLEGTPIGLPANTSSAGLIATCLSSGDYVIAGGTNTSVTTTGIPVLKTNGDSLVSRGVISSSSVSGIGYPIQVVSSNRIVFLGSSQLSGTTIAVGTYQLRLLNVEIAK